VSYVSATKTILEHKPFLAHKRPICQQTTNAIRPKKSDTNSLSKTYTFPHVFEKIPSPARGGGLGRGLCQKILFP
jgi:hypothetical protein